MVTRGMSNRARNGEVNIAIWTAKAVAAPRKRWLLRESGGCSAKALAPPRKRWLLRESGGCAHRLFDLNKCNYIDGEGTVNSQIVNNQN